MIPAATHEPVRGALRVLVVVAAFLTVLAVASPAGAAESCGRQVIDDWYDNGRVDGTYALHCYDDAIEILPRDVRDYSSAKDDIQRALQNRKRGEPAPPATADPTPGAVPPTDTTGTDSTETDDNGRAPLGRLRRSADRDDRGLIRGSRERELRSDPAPDPRRPRAPADRRRLRRAT